MNVFYHEYFLNQKEKYHFYMASVLMGFISSYAFYQSFFVSICFACIAASQRKRYENYLAYKRCEELNLQFKDALYTMTAAFTAGHQMGDAIIGASDGLKLIYDENTPIIKEFQWMKQQIQGSNETPERVLNDFACRSGLEDIKNFADTYTICISTGGNMDRVISKTTDMIVERITVMEEMKAITSQKKMEVKILMVIPLIIILFLQFSSPEYLEIMYTTVMGRTIMTLGLVGLSLAYILSKRIVDLKF